MQTKVRHALAQASEQVVAQPDSQPSVGAVGAGEMYLAGYTPAPAGPFAPDEDGFISDWLVMGPFANPGQRPYSVGRKYDFLRPIGGEANVRLRAGISVIYEFPPNRPEWTSVPPRGEVKAKQFHFPTSFVNLPECMPLANHVVAYAYCNVTVPETTQAKLCVGSDDGIQVWLNGKQVINKLTYRAAFPDQDCCEVELVAGENRVMVKVDTDIGGWGFYLRFLDAAGGPIILEVGW